MREVQARIAQVGGGLLAVALILALGAVSLREQYSASTPGTGRAAMSAPLPSLSVLVHEPAPSYRLTSEEDQSMSTRHRALARVVVDDPSNERCRAACQRMVQRLLKDDPGLQAITVLVFPTRETADLRNPLAATHRLVYALDRCGWDGTPGGQPVELFQSLAR